MDPNPVIPAKAGIHGGGAWIPAFAGMTVKQRLRLKAKILKFL
jgi:hypothetical protein